MTSGSVTRAVHGVMRDAAEIEHGEDVGVADFVLQAEAEHVELIERRERFQRVNRQPMPAQDRFEIEPRREGPFAGPLRVGVHDAVQHLQAVMAHADRVGVGKSQAEPAANLPVILGDAVRLAAGILGRRRHAGQQSEDFIAEGRVEHEMIIAAINLDYPTL